MKDKSYNFAVIGNPVKHSLSPEMHKIFLSQLGIKGKYQSVELLETELDSFFKEMRGSSYDGLNVTIPFKEDVLNYLDEVDINAANIGAVNCILQSNGKLVGYNTDYSGFLKSLQKNNLNPFNEPFVVLGAGGVARAVVYALVKSNAGLISILNRDIQRAEILQKCARRWSDKTEIQVESIDQVENFISEVPNIVNCTSVGMSPDIDDSLITDRFLTSKHKLIETIYNPLYTEFLKQGLKKEAKVIKGLEMFIFQGLESLRIWLNREIEQKINIEEVSKKLEKQL